MTAWITDVVNVMELGSGIGSGSCGSGRWVTTRSITIITLRIIVSSSGSGSSWRVATIIITIITLRIDVTILGSIGRGGIRWVATGGITITAIRSLMASGSIG